MGDGAKEGNCFQKGLMFWLGRGRGVCEGHGVVGTPPSIEPVEFREWTEGAGEIREQEEPIEAMDKRRNDVSRLV